jgi:hypothetical protein
VEVTPVIIEDKGIEMKIKLFYDGKAVKEQTVFTRNLESVVVELYEKKDEYIKIADKITPLVQVIKPVKMYPFPVEEIKISGAILLLKNKKGHTGVQVGGVSSLSAKGDGKVPIFLYFFLKGKGVYVMSFKPFKGAKPLGIVKGNIIRIKHRDDYFEYITRENIFPHGKWLVWIRHNPHYNFLSFMTKESRKEDENLSEKKRKERIQFYNKANLIMGISAGNKLLDKIFK